MNEEDKLHYGWYIALFIFAAIVFNVILRFLFNVPREFSSIVSMSVSFVVSYGVYGRIESDKSNLARGLTVLVGVFILGLASGIVALPLFIFYVGWKEALIVYAVGIGIIIILVTILSWLTNKSPQEVLRESRDLLF